MSLIWAAVKITIGLLVLLAEGVCWLFVGASNTVHLIGEVVAARRRLSGGILHCARGHEVPTEGLTWECTSCAFRYHGSVWRCENPACHAVTPFVYCPVCRVSVRSPYIFVGSHAYEGK